MFKIRLKRDTGIYSPDLVVENSNSSIYFDSSRAYRGYLEGSTGLVTYWISMFSFVF